MFVTIGNVYNFSGKILIIGGGIANFTNVAATFKVFSVILYLKYVHLVNIILKKFYILNVCVCSV